MITLQVVHSRLRRFAGDRTTPPLLRERNLLGIITLFWFTIGGVSWLLSYALSFGSPEGPITLGRASGRWVYAVLWWMATIVAIWLADTFTVRDWRQYPWMLFHAVAGAVVALLWSIAAYYINLAIIPGWRPEGVWKMVNTTALTTWFFYTGIIALVHAVIYAREYRAREIKALQAAHLSTEAQLQALKMQLQPHFLFNALNSISTLMHRDVKAANEMLVLISEMLQRTLERVRTQEVTLADELSTAQLYLEIEQIRFQDRLSVVWDVDPDVQGALVPHMLLQPIIENSIRHGIQSSSDPGRIEISARVQGEWLRIEVRDNGRGLSQPSGRVGFGIGLAVTQERLSRLYGSKHKFVLTDASRGGALVRISIPFIRGDQSSLQEAVHAKTDPGSDR